MEWVLKWLRTREWIPDISGEVRGKNMRLLRAKGGSAVLIIHGLCAGLILGADSFNSSPVFRGRAGIISVKIGDDPLFLSFFFFGKERSSESEVVGNCWIRDNVWAVIYGLRVDDRRAGK